MVLEVVSSVVVVVVVVEVVYEKHLSILSHRSSYAEVERVIVEVVVTTEVLKL